MSGLFLVVVSIALFIAAAAARNSPWALPLLAGGGAALLFAAYQRWWMHDVLTGAEVGSRRLPRLRRRHAVRAR